MSQRECKYCGEKEADHLPQDCSKKPFSEYNAAEVQNWFHAPGQEDVKVFAEMFAGISGSSIVGLTEEQLQKYTKNELKGMILFNAIKKAAGTSAAVSPVPPVVPPDQGQVEKLAEIDRRVAALEIKGRERLAGSTTFVKCWDFVKERGEQVSFWIPAATPGGYTLAWSELPPDSEYEDEYQDFFCQELERLCAGDFCHFKCVDTHVNPYLDGRKPDVSFCPKGEELSIANVSIVGELKAARERSHKRNQLGKMKTDFSAEDKGQIITFAESVLLVQPFREHVTAFLCDCHHIMFFRVTRTSGNSLQYSWTTRQPLFSVANVPGRRRGRAAPTSRCVPQAGFNWLLSLLATEPKDIGMENIPRYHAEALPLNMFLGRGATSYVYGSTKKTVLKVVKEEYKDLVRQEVNVLAFLNTDAEIQKFVPKVVNHESNMVQMMPQAKPLPSSLTFADCANLVKVLKKLHERWVHRDVRPDNLLWSDLREAVLLIDFGFAVALGEEQAYSGTIHYASPRVLDLLAAGHQSFVSRPEDDLVSLIFSIFATMLPHFRHRLQNIATTDFCALRAHWALFLALPPWKAVYDAAVQTDYSAVVDALAKLLP